MANELSFIDPKQAGLFQIGMAGRRQILLPPPPPVISVWMVQLIMNLHVDSIWPRI